MFLNTENPECVRALSYLLVCFVEAVIALILVHWPAFVYLSRDYLLLLVLPDFVCSRITSMLQRDGCMAMRVDLHYGRFHVGWANCKHPMDA